MLFHNFLLNSGFKAHGEYIYIFTYFIQEMCWIDTLNCEFVRRKNIKNGPVLPIFPYYRLDFGAGILLSSPVIV